MCGQDRGARAGLPVSVTPTGAEQRAGVTRGVTERLPARTPQPPFRPGLTGPTGLYTVFFCIRAAFEARNPLKSAISAPAAMHKRWQVGHRFPYRPYRAAARMRRRDRGAGKPAFGRRHEMSCFVVPPPLDPCRHSDRSRAAERRNLNAGLRACSSHRVEIPPLASLGREDGCGYVMKCHGPSRRRPVSCRRALTPWLDRSVCTPCFFLRAVGREADEIAICCSSGPGRTQNIAVR